MANKLLHIQQKIDSIQFGLLRLRDEDNNNSWQVRTTTNDDETLNCIITDHAPLKKLVNKNVNLIQKYHDDYLYITGKVDEEVNTKTKILSIRILKACWFVRKTTKGGVSWLQEKYIYENYPAEAV